MRRSLPVALLALAASGLGARACASNDDQAPTAAGAHAGASGAAGKAGAAAAGAKGGGSAGSSGTSGQAGDAGAAGSAGAPVRLTCAGNPVPELIPTDWKEWTGWSCNCSLFYPPDGAAAIAPVTWEPCDGPAPPSVDCQRTKFPFPGIVVTAPRMALDGAAGKPIAQVSLFNGSSVTDVTSFVLAFDAETGAVLSVASQPSFRACGDGAVNAGQLWQSGISPGHHLVQRIVGAKTETMEGWIDLPFPQSEPHVGERLPPMSKDYTAAWHPAAQGVFGQYVGSLSFAPWGGAREAIWSPSTDPDGLPAVRIAPLPEQGALIEVGGLISRGAWGWTSKTGLVPILRKFGDSTQGSGAVGSDGKDLVWIQGTGKLANLEAPYAKIDVMTAPLVFDAAAVAAGARRLKSARESDFTSPFTVGCGHAARRTFSDAPPAFNGIEIVRLSDGASWLLTSDLVGLAGRWDLPLLVTCSDVFVMLSKSQPPGIGIARIRLDTLGAPTPAD